MTKKRRGNRRGRIEGGDTELCAASPISVVDIEPLSFGKNGSHSNFRPKKATGRGSPNPLGYVRPPHVGYYSSSDFVVVIHSFLIPKVEKGRKFVILICGDIIKVSFRFVHNRY